LHIHSTSAQFAVISFSRTTSSSPLFEVV
jgi:hypothetical protein